jgi:hypothetical protein
MPFAIDHRGRPLFLISNMAMHTQNLKADSRSSLFVGQANVDGDPLGSARATVIGLSEPFPPGELDSVREAYLASPAQDLGHTRFSRHSVLAAWEKCFARSTHGWGALSLSRSCPEAVNRSRID